MKRQWLYNEDGGKLFESEEAIQEAIKNGYVDTPAKLEKTEGDTDTDTDTDTDAKGGAGSYFDFKEATVEELKDKLKVTELRKICKDLEITGMSKKPEQECAEAIYNYFHE